MAALTENRYTKHRDGIITAHPVKAAAHIFKGSLVCADSSGYAVPADDAASYTVLGVAIEEADNGSGSNGDVSVRVQAGGVFSFARAGTIGQGDLGAALYVADDQSVGLSAAVTNDIPCGRLEALDGTGAVWLRLQL
jgi:hypothetical protein